MKRSEAPAAAYLFILMILPRMHYHHQIDYRLKSLRTAINLLNNIASNPSAPAEERERAEHRRAALSRELHELRNTALQSRNEA